MSGIDACGLELLFALFDDFSRRSHSATALSVESEHLWSRSCYAPLC